MTIKEEQIAAGFVLKSNVYKESDALIYIYTKEYGKISLVAKGIKKMKSKNASGCQTLSLSEFSFIPRVGLSTLIKASLINYYRHIKEDIVLEAYASYFCEFVYKHAEENDPDEELYNSLLTAINCLEEGYNYSLVYLLFNAMILRVTGSSLEVDECVYCGNKNSIKAISYTGGGFVCDNCVGEYDKICSKEILQAFRHINRFKLSDIDKIKIEEDTINQLIPIMEYYIDEFTGIIFKTRKFIKQFQSL